MHTLSVVIPTYNEESVLPVLLDAISRQTLQAREVMVADANSTDRTREIARGFGALIVEGGLPAVGRNRGAKRASGESIVFLDADAVLPDEGFFARSLTEMDTRDLVIACPDITATKGIRARMFFWIYTRFSRLTIRRNPHAIGTCIFVRRDIHEAIGGWDEGIFYAEDNDYGRRAAKLGTFGYLNEVVKTPPRRFERDGYLRSALMNITAELHIRFFGPIRSDIFKYRFGHSPQKKK
ncbi:hypothetical protein A3D69_02280 [Candidatus Uhrbacteria bacterium RIFCSPHIGHO2_02_FULL_54_11]|nr:MAG: hypothetical protein A3D69_02280 [Candidatus Uhrbacteria bacterium RIFCSPHIGHO2_02_FULL_54_11]